MQYHILVICKFFIAINMVDCSTPGKKITPISSRQEVKIFQGNYEATNQQQAIFVSLKSVANEITGTLEMNDELATIKGTYKGNLAKGKITEQTSKKTYDFSATAKGSKLLFSITFPEYNNRTTTFELAKLQTTANTTSSKSKDPKLIGRWRYTEVISSGSGQFYSSFSTDYFAQFNADGSALIWTGKSAGGTKDVTIDGGNSKNLQRMQWYTNGKTLYLVDPKTQKKAPVSYYAEANRIMLSNAKNKKVYQRVSY